MLKYKTYSFENLEVWKEIRELVMHIYKITGRFPNEEKFGLVDQMRRAAFSVANNTSEGTSRKSLKDQARFSEIAFGSLMELLNQSILSLDLNYITEDELINLRKRYDAIGFKLNSLRKSQLKRHAASARLVFRGGF